MTSPGASTPWAWSGWSLSASRPGALTHAVLGWRDPTTAQAMPEVGLLTLSVLMVELEGTAVA